MSMISRNPKLLIYIKWSMYCLILIIIYLAYLELIQKIRHNFRDKLSMIIN